jgi:RND family efflux transporter MFP subunit
MSLVVIGIWLGFLWLLIKVGIFKGWALWMKLSPVAIWLAMQVAVFLPMTWSAPNGPVTVLTHSAQIAPNVSGVVTEVKALSGMPIQKGDVLLQLDTASLEAAIEQIEAQLQLAELQLQQKTQLFEKGSGRGVDVQKLKADVRQFKAKLKDARWDLDQATVTAPSNGFIPSVQLLPGTRVSAGQPVLAFIDTSEQIIGVQIAQNYLRNVKVGQKAEVIFRLFPGQTYPAKVFSIIRANSAGQIAASGQVMAATENKSLPFWVELKLDSPIQDLPPGATGTAAIYTDSFPATHAIRQITLRMTTWMNFISG